MDDIVKAAMAKWPQVPHCYGWLALDARGDWYMRDDRIQQAGPFPTVKGSKVDHDKLKAFICRNYLSDERGAWYFQNGPQRVYVQLEAAPWVLGVTPEPLPGQPHAATSFTLDTHTGLLVAQPGRVLSDEQGRLYLETEYGLGLVRSTDMLAASDWLEAQGRMPEERISSELPKRYGFVLAPQPTTSGG